MFGIFGSGFGLYGHLPSILKIYNERVALPAKYQDKMLSRPDLRPLVSSVVWCGDDNELLDVVCGVSIAVCPSKQAALVKKSLARKHIKNVVLEKPIACNPEDSRYLLNELVKSDKRFRIAYLFIYTPWGERLLDGLKKITEGRGGVSLTWNFTAHHYLNDIHTWKRFSSEGGGAVRFYGIHLIALLAEIGYDEVLESNGYGKSHNELIGWSATFVGDGLPKFAINLNCNASDSTFAVSIEEAPSLNFSYQGPFDEIEHAGGSMQDVRVIYLERLYKTLFTECNDVYRDYFSTQSLWEKVERKLVFEN